MAEKLCLLLNGFFLRQCYMAQGLFQHTGRLYNFIHKCSTGKKNSSCVSTGQTNRHVYRILRERYINYKIVRRMVLLFRLFVTITLASRTEICKFCFFPWSKLMFTALWSYLLSNNINLLVIQKQTTVTCQNNIDNLHVPSRTFKYSCFKWNMFKHLWGSVTRMDYIRKS